MTPKVSPWGWGSGWAVPLGAVYLRSRSEPFGEESERKAPGGGPLSWGDTEVKHFLGEEAPPIKPPLTPLSNLLPGPASSGGREERSWFGGGLETEKGPSSPGQQQLEGRVSELRR